MTARTVPPLDAWLYDGCRSAFGRYGGALAPVRPDELAASAMRSLLERSRFRPDAVDDVILGCSNQAGEDSRNVARNAALLAGLPEHVPGQTVNRLCASGLAAALDAARAVTCGELELVLAGGVESMSRAPFVVGKAQRAFARTLDAFDSTIGFRFPNPRFLERFGDDSLPQTADNVAAEVGVGREESDRFAARSQCRYAKAKDRGFFEDEVVRVEVRVGRGQTAWVSEDEHPRPDTSLEKLAALRPLNPGGVVTAGSASGINDGACALWIGSARAGERAGVAPLVRILAGVAVGVPPRVMGLGPVEAIRGVLERTGLSQTDLDVIEINEAFAPQVLGCLKRLGIPFDDERVNPNGGAIAIGHPLGASGARLLLTAARALRERHGRYAVVSLCVGLGQGLAMLIEAAPE